MMTLTFIFSIYMTCLFSFVFLTHPLSLALNLFFQTLFLSLILSMVVTDPWFSYLLFLVFLGGLLVIFAYVATFASNEKFSMKILGLMAAMVISGFMLFLVPGEFESESLLAEASLEGLVYPEFISISLYSLGWGVTVFLILYLLLSLIIVVRLNRMQDGPLRSF